VYSKVDSPAAELMRLREDVAEMKGLAAKILQKMESTGL
jgi:hypothetical protein